MKEVIIIAPLASLSKRTRLFKIAKYLTSKEVEISHIGWERWPGEAKEDYLSNINKTIILKGGGYGGLITKFFYLFWICSVFFHCMRLKKGSIVWALGFETAFPLLLLKRWRKLTVYFDDADRFSMIFDFPKPIDSLIKRLEKFTSQNVDFHIIPGIERYDFKSEKFYILKNMPSESEIYNARKTFRKEEYSIDSKVIININGWLGSGRGMKTAKLLAKYFCKEDVSFILVGKLDCDDAKELAKYKNVLYLGEVSNTKALESYLASDFVFTYYDPVSKINRFAESNKWGDAIKLSIGVIVNSEVETANYLVQSGAAISFAYDDSKSLINEIACCVNNHDKRTEYKKNIEKLNYKFGYFEEQLTQLFNK